jgi:hypothetical protein
MRSKTLLILLGCFVAVIALVAACERNITTQEITQTAEACFDCHDDQNTFLVAAEAQWSFSVHASGDNIDRNYILFGIPCVTCHTSEGFVAKATGQTIPNPAENPTAIHCFTCHAPHTTTSFGLRVTASQDLANGESADLGGANICAACHQALTSVATEVTDPTELSEHWGPHHGPQSDMLIGTNGYEYLDYDDYPYDQTNHVGVMTDGCLDCHYDKTRNYRIGGHSYNMEFDLEGEEILLTEACSCHGTLADFNYHNVQDSVEVLLADLAARLEAAGLINNTGDPLDDVFTSPDSAGAVWNYLIVREDSSMGVHNAQYIYDLLHSAIQFIQTGPVPSPPAEVTKGKVEDDVAAKRD